MASPKATTPSRGLTAAFVASLRPAPGRYEVPDTRAPGLVLRVMPTGTKVFRWYCTARHRVITIGRWTLNEQPGHVTLEEARRWLERLKQAHAGGHLEAIEGELAAHLRKRERVADPTPEQKNLFKNVVERFFGEDIKRNRKHPEDVRAILDHDLLPVLASKPLDSITVRDCKDAVLRTVDRGAPVHAGKVLATLKQFFNWAQEEELTDRNPAAPIRGQRLGVEVNVSDRWLSTDEIALFWKALDAPATPSQVERIDKRTGKVQRFVQFCPEISAQTQAGLRILLLTAARTGELLRARWEHVDFRAATWTIPPANQKLTREQERKAKPFVIPLSLNAVELFRVLLAAAADSPWVMASPASHDGHFSDKALGRAMRRLQQGPQPVLTLPGGEASPHDLRRTARTHLGKLRVPLHIVERCLNHSLGRIVQTYDHGDYLEERREALEKWDAFVQRIVTPERSNIAFMPAAGA